jgi:hypothetical protein
MLAYSNDLSRRRMRCLFDCWSSAQRWQSADEKTTTCCDQISKTMFVCSWSHLSYNFSFSNAWYFSRSQSHFKSKSLLWMNMKTMSMTWFHYEWTLIERWYRIDQKSFSAFSWILSSIASTSCVKCLKFYSFRLFWSCIEKIKSNDCLRSWRIFFYSSTSCT